MAYQYLTQTWGVTPAGDLTNTVTNEILAALFPNGSGGLDSTAGDAAVYFAEAEANSILGPSFTIPTGTTSTVPVVVKRCICDMAVFFGYDRKPEFLTSNIENPAQKRFDRAKATLKDIKTGARDMGGEASTDKSGLTGGIVYASTAQFITETDESTDGPTGPY
ncbi:MAG: phage protein Gp36 family protein [Brevundimonas sp.]